MKHGEFIPWHPGEARDSHCAQWSSIANSVRKGTVGSLRAMEEGQEEEEEEEKFKVLLLNCR